jgi:long-chain acyl-CoA synthetase
MKINASSAVSVASSSSIDGSLRTTARTHPDVVAFRTLSGDVSLTWGQLLGRVERFASGLAAHGVGPHDTVALMLTNRPEFAIADLAALWLGAAGFSLYATLPPEQIAYQLRNSGAQVIVCEAEFIDVIRAARKLAPDIKHIVVLDAPADSDLLPWHVLEQGGVAPPASEEGSIDDVATLIYTSGTTGPAKGVELTHGNILASAHAVNSVVGLHPGSRVISWLPNAHIAERIAHYYLPILVGASVTCCADARQIGVALSAVRPYWFFAVPRVWEKLRARIEANLESDAADGDDITRGALQRAMDRTRLRLEQLSVPPELLRMEAEDQRRLAPLLADLGLETTRTAQSGAAPCPGDVVMFFRALGLPLTEIWGMSETTGAGAMGRSADDPIGSVGLALPGVELRLEPDGELLVRGPVVMRGYRRSPAQTAEALTADGWLRTGDIAKIDAAGYVRIVDRKKELIINASGKNMSPSNIEAALKSAGPLIGQACVVGDGRPYNVALIVLDPDTAPAWAAAAGLGDGATLQRLAQEPSVLAAVESEVARANAKLSRVEQIKRFHVLDREWLPGETELTPTMKLRRTPIAEKYHGIIDELYR